MKNFLLFSLLCLLSAAPCVLRSQVLAGTDDLGRTLPQNDSVGDPKPNRQVGIFFFPFCGDFAAPTAEYNFDLDKLVREHPEVLTNPDDPNWGGPFGKCYYWGEPIYGYYRGDDYWVNLRSMQLLADARVDFVVVDATNRFTYPSQMAVLFRAMDAVHRQGKTPPRIVFYTNTKSGETIQELYDHYYKEGAPCRYPGCWYYYEGKPLIIGVREETRGKDYENFFTFRESQWPFDEPKVNGWPWISFTRPQIPHYNERGEKEIISVSVCQHPNPGAGMSGSAFYGNTDNWGRSYRAGSPGNPATDLPYGYNAQEQWDYALTQNTPFVFVTGWNEWVVVRQFNYHGDPSGSWFCDEASPEFSRDIEPTLTAGLGDNYYMQLVANIRRYKGLEKNPAPGPEKSIRQLNQWTEVQFAYTDFVGETAPRNHSAGTIVPAIIYTNTTGRNDFHTLKVARDRENLYFYAETVMSITPCQGDNWMRLYLDTDRNPATGWKGYDYRVVRGRILQTWNGSLWQDAGQVACTVEGNRMMVTVDRGSLKNLASPLNLEFKWSDNMQREDPLDWYVNGDTAPGGRFNYIFAE